MLTCKQVLAESKQFFWKNVFHLSHSAIVKLRVRKEFAKQIEEIEISWDGKFPDPAILSSLSKYSKLRVLNLNMWYGCINWDRHRNQNILHQNDQSIRLFSKLRGFDELASLRGLETITLDIYGNIEPENKDKTEKAKATFVEFLNKELKKPRPEPIPEPIPDPVSFEMSSTNSYLRMLNNGWLQKKAGKGKGKAVEDDEASDEEEFENEPQEEVYIPRKSRTRAAKVVKRFGFDSNTGGSLEVDDGDDDDDDDNEGRTGTNEGLKRLR
jgi:hypothetical protein